MVLLGAPVTASPNHWEKISEIVGGRIINGYCKSDWLLRLDFHNSIFLLTNARKKIFEFESFDVDYFL